MKQKQDWEKLKEAIIMEHGTPESFDCLREDIDRLLSQREEEIKRELREKVEEKIKKIDAGKDKQDQVLTYLEKYVMLRKGILSLLAGKSADDKDVTRKE